MCVLLHVRADGHRGPVCTHECFGVCVLLHVRADGRRERPYARMIVHVLQHDAARVYMTHHDVDDDDDDDADDVSTGHRLDAAGDDGVS